MGWRDEYAHERKWKATDPNAPTTQYPLPDESLSESMRVYLESRGLDYACALRAGWYAARYVGPRIIIPCLRTDGGIWWQARTLTDHPKRWMGSSGYKGDAVSLVAGNIPGFLWVCEGPMDALSIAGQGLSAVAVLGASPPDVVLDHVAHLAQGKQTVIVPDNDRLALWQAFQQKLGGRGVFAPLRVVPGGFKDIADMPVGDRIEFLNA